MDVILKINILLIFKLTELRGSTEGECPAPAPLHQLAVMVRASWWTDLAASQWQGAGPQINQALQPVSNKGPSHWGPVANQRHCGSPSPTTKCASSPGKLGRSLLILIEDGFYNRYTVAFVAVVLGNLEYIECNWDENRETKMCYVQLCNWGC